MVSIITDFEYEIGPRSKYQQFLKLFKINLKYVLKYLLRIPVFFSFSILIFVNSNSRNVSNTTF